MIIAGKQVIMFLFVADNQPLMFCRNLRLLIKINYDHISRDKCYDVMSLLWLCYDNDNKTQLRRSPACCPGVAISSTNRKKDATVRYLLRGERFTHLGTWQQPVMRGEQCTMGNYEPCRHFGIILGAKISRQSCGDLWPSCPTWEGSWHLETHNISAPFILMRKTWVIRSNRKGPS